MKYALIAVAVCVIGLFGIIGIYWISVSNKEVGLRNTIQAKQKDNQSQFDLMWKKISQVAQVTDAQKNALIEIFNGHAQARSGKGEDKAIVKWIHESIPTVDTKSFTNLQNIIVSSRDTFADKQRELLDLSREHNNIIDMFPSSLFVGGRGKIDVTIVTSSRTAETFRTGKDDDVQVFQPKIDNKPEAK